MLVWLYFAVFLVTSFGIELKGIYESLSLGGQGSAPSEIVYQLPLDRPPTAILFLAHGCSHSATDWWPAGGGCGTCIGLPVEREVVSRALQRGYAVIALSSSERTRKCWNGKSDVEFAALAIKHLVVVIRDTHGREHQKPFTNSASHLPLYLLGASSGGAFVGVLGTALRPFGLQVSGVCVQIMALQGHEGGRADLPPTLFVHMADRDRYTAEAIGHFISKHIGEGGKLRLKELRVKPKAITPGFFFDHSQALTLADSQALQRSLLEAKYLDAVTLQLVEDPRGSSWREVAIRALPHVVPATDSLVADESAISELLNLAFAQHEITDDFLSETFDFFENKVVARVVD